MNLLEGYRLLKEKMPAANLPSVSITEDGVRIDYLDGEFVEDTLLQRASGHDREGIKDALARFRSYLEALGMEPNGALMNGTVKELLPDFSPGRLDEMMPVANLDLTFDNVVIDADGRYWMTDYEWVFDSPVPRSFIMYRSLYVLFLRHGGRLNPVMSFPDALIECGVPEPLWECYRQACERFIDLVFGEDRPFMIPSGYRKTTHLLASASVLENRERQLTTTTLELEATKSALNEMIAYSKMRDGRLHEQESRLGELSNKIVELESAVAEKEGALGTVRIELESERLRLAAEHTQLEIERSHAFELIAELESERKRISQLEADLIGERARTEGILEELGKERRQVTQLMADLDGERVRREGILRELEGEQVLSRQLRQEMDLVRADLRIAMEAMARKELELAEITGQRDENFVHLQDMTERFMSKQAELMTMSDWARSMQLRLEFLESIPTIRLTEKVARTQKLAVEKLRSEGIVETLKGAAFKASPQKVQQMFYHQEPSNMKELEEDAKGRDLLVVFPVIPWEFRWQRPQQLVSRFAEHGYTVIFVNMTLNPKGSRYLNDAEALKDVGLGKLRDHVFEVRLSTFDKVNVYQDRLKGPDLNNVAHGLLSVLRELEPKTVAYLVQFPGWDQLANTARSRVDGTLIFDCMDDHAGFSNNSTEVVKRETKLMERCDLVVTSSTKLFEKASAFNENTILVRNGTDFDMFHTLFPNGKLDNMKHPIIGYHGAISEWFDPGAVQRCAEKHPEWNFVLIGSTLGCEVNGLKKLPNVHLLGELPYKELPGYLHYFDVCVIPFKVCELTLATNPVKFYEYISSGKPVVSVKLPEMVQYADICYLYEGDDEFEKGILAALAEKDDGLKERRIEIARKSSWDQRFHDIREHLSKMDEGEGKRRKVL